MTTIAWDGKSISADTQSTSGSTVLPCPTKLIVIQEHLEIEGKKIFLIATAGTSGDERHSLKYIRDGGLESGEEMHGGGGIQYTVNNNYRWLRIRLPERPG